jgi:hypothetical protein
MVLWKQLKKISLLIPGRLSLPTNGVYCKIALMLSVRGAVKRSLHASLSPEKTQARKRELESVPNSLKRQVLLGTHAVATRYPRTAASLLRIGYPDTDLEEYAIGTNSIVYRYGKNNLLKVVKGTENLSFSQRRDMLVQMQTEYQAVRHHLGSMVIPHDIFVARHPLMRDGYAIQIRQDFVDYDEAKLFINGSASLNKDGFSELLSRSDSMPQQLSNLVASSHQLKAKSGGLLPDFNGVANFGTNLTGELIHIDPQPVTPSNKGYGLAVRQLARLESELLAQAA